MPEFLQDRRELLERLDGAGGLGADSSLGDPLAAEAAAAIRRLQKQAARNPPKTLEAFMDLPLKRTAYNRGLFGSDSKTLPPARPYEPDTVTWGNGFVLGYDHEGFFRRPI